MGHMSSHSQCSISKNVDCSALADFFDLSTLLQLLLVGKASNFRSDTQRRLCFRPWRPPVMYRSGTGSQQRMKRSCPPPHLFLRALRRCVSAHSCWRRLVHPMPPATAPPQRVYTGEWQGSPAVIKWRFPKAYRHPALDSKLTKARTRAEHRALERCAEAGIPAPTLLHADDAAGIVIMSKVDGVTAASAFRAVDAAGAGLDAPFRVTTTGAVEVEPAGGSSLDAAPSAAACSTLRELAGAIGTAVAAVHSAGIVHGDLTTSNVMVSPGDHAVTLIDFGLASRNTNRSQEDLGVDLYVLERAFTSSHPKQDGAWKVLLAAYMGAVTGADAVQRRFSAVRARGRKRMAVG